MKMGRGSVAFHPRLICGQFHAALADLSIFSSFSKDIECNSVLPIHNTALHVSPNHVLYLTLTKGCRIISRFLEGCPFWHDIRMIWNNIDYQMIIRSCKIQKKTYKRWIITLRAETLFKWFWLTNMEFIPYIHGINWNGKIIRWQLNHYNFCEWNIY